MAIDPIKIPQNVYIEDRIVGPLTLKQIITVAVGCGFSYALYSLLIQSYGAVPIPIMVMAWVPGALSFLFAFLRINDLSLFRIVLLSMERFNKPAVRTWTPRRGIVVNIRTFTTAETAINKEKTDEALQKKNPQQIDELSTILDRTLPKSDMQPAAAAEPEAASPLEETVDDTEVEAPRTLPVNASLISASPLSTDATMDTVSPPKTGSVSIFRDISPA